MYIYILTFLKNFWKPLAIIFIIGGGIYYIYDYGYDKGNLVAVEECNKRMKYFNDKLESRILELQVSSTKLSEDSKVRSILLKQDLNKLMALTKNKPLTIIKEGKCVPSEIFIDTYNAAIIRINSK